MPLLYQTYINGTWQNLYPDTGSTGVVGAQGVQGIQGETGPAGVQGPIGATGPQGDAGASSADLVSYNNVTYPTVEDALDALFYVAPAISLYSLSVGTVEIGTTVTDVVANWSFNKTMTSATLTDTVITPTDTVHSFSGLSLTTNKTYTLTGSDGVGNASSSKTVSFSHKRYWGVSASPTLNNTEILALSSEFSSSNSKSLSYDCTGGRYPYFVFLASLGTPTATVNGLPMTALTVTDQSFTNASGHIDTFRVVRFTNLINGIVSVVWS